MRGHSHVPRTMIGRVTIRDAIRATAGAVDLLDRMGGQMERAFHSSAPGNGTNAFRPTIHAEEEAIVSAQRGVVLQRVTAEDLLRLPEASNRHVLVLERAMQNHYEDWVRVFPKLDASSEACTKTQWQRQLRGIVVQLQDDVEEVMGFLELAGLRLDGHYAHLRSMVRSIGSAETTGGNASDGTGFTHP